MQPLYVSLGTERLTLTKLCHQEARCTFSSVMESKLTHVIRQYFQYPSKWLEI